MLRSAARASAWGPLAAALAWTACTGDVVAPQPAGTGGAAASTSASSGTATSGTAGGGQGGGVEVPCTSDVDCVDDPAGPVCSDAGQCVPCLNDADCALGTVCVDQACLPGCSLQHPCALGLTCCDDQCVDLASDLDNCGMCATPCPDLPHAGVFCARGFCTMGRCEPGYADCDQYVDTGCEQNVADNGPCACVPDTSEACYSGPAGTQGVGPCLAGVHTCNANGTAFGPCVGELLPAAEGCPDLVDDDCNGVADDAIVSDIDGDGWTVCDGDCVEQVDMAHPVPAYINPGALEILDNGIDDDCDPATSDTIAPPLCSSAESLTGLTAAQLAEAMDICQVADALAPLPLKTWGLLNAELRLADGAMPNAADLATFQDVQTAVLTGFGATIVPKRGPTLAAFSTGGMRAPGMAGYTTPAPGSDLGRAGQPPSTFLVAHGGLLPASGSCNGACPSGSGANDGVTLRLTVRAPTNASSFSYHFLLLSSEYANVCSTSNDTYLALLQTAAPGMPADLDVAYDALGNVVSTNNLFFDACVPAGCATCPLGAASLQGTGFEAGGATQWLQADAPVVFGETITLDLTLFDVSDGLGDTVVLHDNFRFNTACPPGGCAVIFP